MNIFALWLLVTTGSCTPEVQTNGDSLRVPILVYHNIQPAAEGRSVHRVELTMRPEVFAEQMQYLKDHGVSVISLAELVDALEGKRTLPHPAVVLTFDDGRVNQYEHAFPVLKRLGFTASFFPFTHAIGRNPRYFTWDELLEMQKAGMTIGSHTNLHVRVDKIHDPATWNLEVQGSRDVLRAHLGTSVEFFSYPFGALAAAGDSAVRAVGYRAARAFTGGPWNRPSDIWRLRAVPMTEDMRHFERLVDPGCQTAKVTSARPERPRTPRANARSRHHLSGRSNSR